MARRAQFRDEDLLEAARVVFLERGARATTAEVARRAGVSEGTIFHHFKSKGALFEAALSLAESQPPEVMKLADRIGQGTVAENLVDFATAHVEWLRMRVPLMLLAWANTSPEEKHRLQCTTEPMISALVKLLAGYVEGEARQGRLRRVDPEVAARALLGAIFEYVRSELVDGGLRGLPLPAPMFVRGLVDIFLHGTAAPTLADSRRRTRRKRA